MEFDENGLLTPEAILQLEEIERQAIRANNAWKHNIDVRQIEEIASKIASHCLSAVADKRNLLTQEGALNVSIFEFLVQSGYPIIKGDSNQKDWLHSTDESGGQVATEIPRIERIRGSIPDFLMYNGHNRLELKTAACATSKDQIPKAFFEKDLYHLQRHEFEDQETYPWEGVPRERRNAEIAVLVCDISLALNNQEITDMFGAIQDSGRNSVKGHDGVTYVSEVGNYKSSFALQAMGRDSEPVEKFVVLIAFPSLRDGA